MQPPPSSRLQTWAKTHTFVCLYISNNKPCEWLQSNFSRLLKNRKSYRRVQNCRHTCYVTTGASHNHAGAAMISRLASREARGMQLRLWWPLRAPPAPHASCCMCCTSPWLCSEVSCAHSRAVPCSHATDPANAFTSYGAVGDGRASFGSSIRHAAHFSSVASPRPLTGGGSDACAPAVDLAALMQLTAWIKQLGELIRMQDGEDSRFVALRARAVSVLESWVQRWYDGQAIYPP